MRRFQRIESTKICYSNIGDKKMTLSCAIQKRIDELLQQKEMNVNMLGISAGINPATIRGILKGRIKTPNSQTLYYICIGFGITLEQFFNSHLFNPNNIDDD